MKNILVALDLSSVDKSLVKYTDYLTSLFKIEKIIFIHNIKKYEITDLFKEQLEDVDIEQVISDELENFVEEHFQSDVDHETIVSADVYTESLISYVVNKYRIDTVVLGNKHDSSGILPTKLVRLLKCQLLWVPEKKDYSVNKIWIGTDFSNSSLRSFEMAHHFNKKSDAKVEGVHVYNLPLHFSPYLSSYKIKEKVHEATKKRCTKFKKKISQSTKIHLVPGRDANVAHVMKDLIEYNDVDLLIVSDKGNSSFSPFFIGSITEELMNQDINIPLMIVKKYPAV